jgi:hypothetical protein
MLTFRRGFWGTLGILVVAVLVGQPTSVGPAPEVALAEPAVRIESPIDGAVVSGRIDIHVTVAVADANEIDFYRLYVGGGEGSTSMRPLGPPHTVPVSNEAIASLDTTLLHAGAATLQLRLYPKSGDEVDSTVVVTVLAGPTPTRTLSGPIVEVPPIAVAPAPVQSSAPASIANYPSSGLIDISLPDFSVSERTAAPIPRLNPENIYDTLPGDPVQTDPVLDDIFTPPPPAFAPTSPNIVPIPR